MTFYQNFLKLSLTQGKIAMFLNFVKFLTLPFRRTSHFHHSNISIASISRQGAPRYIPLCTSCPAVNCLTDLVRHRHSSSETAWKYRRFSKRAFVKLCVWTVQARSGDFDYGIGPVFACNAIVCPQLLPSAVPNALACQALYTLTNGCENVT